MSDQPTTRIEWGIKMTYGYVWTSEQHTEALVRRVVEAGVGQAVRREVTTGPWTTVGGAS